MYSENEKQEIMKLNNGVHIKNTDINYVMYLPPEPRVEIYDSYNNIVDTGKIVLTSQNGSYSKTLTINQLGRIDVGN
jgi:hypothetical protein